MDSTPETGVENLSNLSPLASRDTSITVYPTDPQNDQQLLETDTFLKGLYGKDHVKFNSQDARLSWTISVQDGDTFEALQGYPGLLLGKENDESKRDEVVKRDDLYYIVIAANPDDDEQTKTTLDFLKSKAKNKNENIYPLHKSGTHHVMAWGNIQLTSDAKVAVEAYEGVDAPLIDEAPVEEDRALLTDRYLDVRTTPKSNEFWSFGKVSRSVEKRASPIKRAVTFTKQADAPQHLVMVSQPEEMKNDQLHDFVYDQNAGLGTYIYVIDSGAATNSKNIDGDEEFERVEHLQTQHSKDDGEKEDEDGSGQSHGTIVSSQATGKKYSVAKAATLVSVKLRSRNRITIDFLQGLDTIISDLKDKPDRQAKSVVISSLGFKRMDHEEAKTDREAILMRNAFDTLFGMGVPFISSSGNYGPFYKTINKLPKVLEDPDTPIINVGAVDLNGNTPDLSQGGPQLTISAMGVDVPGLPKEGGKEIKKTGTSHSAPQVAGVIATYLNYDPPPWDGSKTGKERVQAIKDFIRTDASSWARKNDRVIWNGATKADHQAAGARTCDAPNSKLKRDDSCGAKPQCTQVKLDANNAYVLRDTLADLIDNQYCPKLQGMNSGVGLGSYLQDTPEMVEIGAIGDLDVQDKPSSVDDCKTHLHEVLDGCDVPTNDYNPMNWKAGGEIKVDGWNYTLRPLHDRPPALNKPKAWCQIDTCDEDGCTLRMWGAGWESSNFGQALRQKLDDFTKQAKASGEIGDNKGYDTGSWGENFIYELMDGHEWAVTLPMNLGLFSKFGPTTANVMRLVANNLEVDDCKEI